MGIGHRSHDHRVSSNAQDVANQQQPAQHNHGEPEGGSRESVQHNLSARPVAVREGSISLARKFRDYHYSSVTILHGRLVLSCILWQDEHGKDVVRCQNAVIPLARAEFGKHYEVDAELATPDPPLEPNFVDACRPHYSCTHSHLLECLRLR